MAEQPHLYGPDQIPTLPNGEYDAGAVVKYLKSVFDSIFGLAFKDELGKRRLAQYGNLSADFTLISGGGLYRYTVKRTIDPQYTQYKIEPSETGEQQSLYENDLFLGVEEVGPGYQRIIFSCQGDGDGSLAVEKVEFIRGCQYIKDAGVMIKVANIVNLLQPAQQQP